PSANAGNRIQQLQADGFQIGSDADANSSNDLYIWVAWVHANATAVKLASATATRYDTGTFVQWRTGYEVDNLGFHVYREIGGVRTRVTAGLLAGSALLVGHGTASGAGNSYGFWDAGRETGTTYWLADVDLQGHTT